MKTKDPSYYNLTRILKYKRKYGDPALWICGKEMWRTLLDMYDSKVIFFSFYGTRTLFNIPVRIGHSKLNDDEIILINKNEIKWIR